MTALTHDQRLAGFYTLASTSLLLSELPVNLGKKLPRYPSVPAVRMGRLAVDQDFKGLGLGGAWVADGLVRAIRAEIAAYVLWWMQRTNQQLIISWQPVERTVPGSRRRRRPRKIRWRPGAADWPDWPRRCNSHNGQIRRLARQA